MNYALDGDAVVFLTSADGPGLRQRLSSLPVRPWAPGDRLHYVRIIPMTITGTRTLTSG